MIAPTTTDRKNAFWAQATALLLATVALPLGLVYAQDYDAVEKRLGKAVGNGELTIEHAHVMLEALKNTDQDKTDDLKSRLRDIGRRLKSAVAEGRMTEQEARDKWHTVKEEQIAPHLKAAVGNGALSRAEAWAKWHAARKRHDDHEGHPKGHARTKRKTRSRPLQCHVCPTVKQNWPSEAQVREKRTATRMSPWPTRHRKPDKADTRRHFKPMDLDDEQLLRMWNHLEEGGLNDKQIKQTLKAIPRIIHQLKPGGEDFELKPQLHEYLADKLALTDEQVERVLGLARRMADHRGHRHGHRRPRGIKEHYRNLGVTGETLTSMREHLSKHSFSEEQIDQALGAILRLVHALKSQGDSFELDARLHDHFTNKMNLGDEQIEVILDLARRVVHGPGQSDDGAIEDARQDH